VKDSSGLYFMGVSRGKAQGAVGTIGKPTKALQKSNADSENPKVRDDASKSLVGIGTS